MLVRTVRSLTRAAPRRVLPVAAVRSIHASRVARSGPFPQHRNTPENNPETPFAFSAANKPKIDTILARYPPQYKQSAVMPLLQLAQEQNDNWLPLTAMNKIAEMLDMPPIRVYEVATFYSMYNRTPMGKYHIQLCGTTPCQLCGAEQIGEAIVKHLGINMGETTADGMFTVTEVECLGACVNAPMIQVNNHEFYENLTKESVVKLLDQLRTGGFAAAKVGPQTEQKNCEGPQGKTSLFKIPAPVVRDIDALLKANVKPTTPPPTTPVAGGTSVPASGGTAGSGAAASPPVGTARPAPSSQAAPSPRSTTTGSAAAVAPTPAPRPVGPSKSPKESDSSTTTTPSAPPASSAEPASAGKKTPTSAATSTPNTTPRQSAPKGDDKSAKPTPPRKK